MEAPQLPQYLVPDGILYPHFEHGRPGSVELEIIGAETTGNAAGATGEAAGAVIYIGCGWGCGCDLLCLSNSRISIKDSLTLLNSISVSLVLFKSIKDSLTFFSSLIPAFILKYQHQNLRVIRITNISAIIARPAKTSTCDKG